MSRLIVSADDGGLAANSDSSILRCASEGVVRSISVVAGGPTAEEFLERASDLDLG
ncbi:MAG: ChbG/HpnK family deacetylase, partial [Planctomycetota bacterium]